MGTAPAHLIVTHHMSSSRIVAHAADRMQLPFRADPSISAMKSV
jgi:hypothetical protein